MTRVSVVIPTRDRPREVRFAVRSVLAQSFADLEVHVVDDGSCNPLDLQFEDPRLHVHRHETPRGVSKARNTAIRCARGDWIAFLDDDDLWHPDKLANQLQTASEESANFVYTATEVITPDGRLLQRRAAPAAEVVADDLERYNVIGGPSSVMAKRELLPDRDPFFAGLSVVADWDLWLRLRHTARFAPVAASLVAVLEHAGSMQIEGATAIEGELETLRARHPELLSEGNAPRHTSSMRLWTSAKVWQSRPSWKSGSTMVRAAAAHHGVRGTATRLLRRSAVRREPTPDWVTQLLKGEHSHAVPAPRAIGPEAPAARIATR